MPFCQPAALDITVIIQQCTIGYAADHALSMGEARKIAAHAASCWESGVLFVPIVFKAPGGLCELYSCVQPVQC